MLEQLIKLTILLQIQRFMWLGNGQHPGDFPNLRPILHTSLGSVLTKLCLFTKVLKAIHPSKTKAVLKIVPSLFASLGTICDTTYPRKTSVLSGLCNLRLKESRSAKQSHQIGELLPISQFS